jgi:hypothetical protein
VLLDRALVNGNYYTEDGLRLAVANAVQEIESGRRIPRPSAEAGATAGVAAPATRLTPSDRSAS